MSRNGFSVNFIFLFLFFSFLSNNELVSKPVLRAKDCTKWLTTKIFKKKQKNKNSFVIHGTEKIARNEGTLCIKIFEEKKKTNSFSKEFFFFRVNRINKNG